MSGLMTTVWQIRVASQNLKIPVVTQLICNAFKHPWVRQRIEKNI